MAASTGDGSSDSDEHALPEWAATPAWSSPRSTASASTPSTPTHTRWGRRSTGSPYAHDAVDGQRGFEQTLGLGAGDARLGFERAGVERDGGGAETGDGRHVLHARPSGALLLTADEQRPQPQPPAHEQRAGAVRAPELVGADRHQVRAERVEVDGDVAGGLGRVEVHEHPAARHAVTTSVTGCRVPTSWLPHCRCTSAVRPGRTAAMTCSGSTRPTSSTPTHVTSSRSEASRTAECSTSGHTTWVPRSDAPQVAALIASVPPLVNTTSRPRRPSSAATCSRASSMTPRAIRPSVCTRPGSAPPARRGTIASTTEGRAGEVDA